MFTSLMYIFNTDCHRFSVHFIHPHVAWTGFGWSTRQQV